MWVYEKKLQYPVKIKTPNAKTAKYIISQLGGPDGELAASLRYMNQRYTAQPDKVKGILTDVATEELAHVEMISAILYQLTDGLTPEQIKEAGFDAYFVDHTLGVYPQSAAGVPFTAAYFQSKGDPITDLTEDLAAEQKARSTYDNILRMCEDPDVRDPIKFLRQREIVHFQRFGEALRQVQDDLHEKARVAFPTSTGSTPVAIGSSVPVCPSRRICRIPRSLPITSKEVNSVGLFMQSTPCTVSRFMRCSILFALHPAGCCALRQRCRRPGIRQPSHDRRRPGAGRWRIH